MKVRKMLEKTKGKESKIMRQKYKNKRKREEIKQNQTKKIYKKNYSEPNTKIQLINLL